MPDEKAALRRSVVAGLRAIPAEARARQSTEVLSRARSERVWLDAGEILAYHPMREEVDVVPLLHDAIASRGVVWLPRIQGGELSFRAVRSLESETTPGQFGILEPHVSLPVLDAARTVGPILVLTPGVAFDGRGARLGRGRGYYDRFLRGLRAAAPGRVIALALAFSTQIVDHVPTDTRDERVDLVLTERGRIVVTDGLGGGA